MSRAQGAGALHRPLDLDERLVFGKLELLTNRMEKLSELFSTVDQFKQLAKHGVEGMGPLLSSFQTLVTSMRAKPYSLLDYTQVRR